MVAAAGAGTILSQTFTNLGCTTGCAAGTPTEQWSVGAQLSGRCLRNPGGLADQSGLRALRITCGGDGRSVAVAWFNDTGCAQPADYAAALRRSLEKSWGDRAAGLELYSPVRFVFLRIPHLGPDSNPKPDPAP